MARPPMRQSARGQARRQGIDVNRQVIRGVIDPSGLPPKPLQPGGLIPGKDRALERAIDATAFRNWDPMYHFREWDTYGDLQNDLVAEGSKLGFFINFPTPKDRTLINVEQPGRVNYPWDIDGIGIVIFGQNRLPGAEGEVPNLYSVDWRRVVLEHTRVEYMVKGSRKLVDHHSMMIPPGLGISGSLATTANNVDRTTSFHGVPHPRAYYRFGGPDTSEVEMLDKDDEHVAYIHFDAGLVQLIGQLVDNEVPVKDYWRLKMGLIVYGWSWKPVS